MDICLMKECLLYRLSWESEEVLVSILHTNRILGSPLDPSVPEVSMQIQPLVTYT